MISYLGWNFNISQGQFRADPELVKEYIAEREEDHVIYDGMAENMRITRGLPPDPHWDDWKPWHPSDGCRNQNLWALYPIVNFFVGALRIKEALDFQSRDQLYVEQKVEFWARLLLFTVGVLEITWIGGILAHGIASIYFHFTKKEEIPENIPIPV